MKKHLFLILLICLIVSCGKSPSDNSNQNSSSTDSLNVNSCDTETINDYLRLVNSCNISQASYRSEITKCISQAQYMTSKYPDLKCTMQMSNENIQIDSNSIKEIQKNFNFDKYFNYKSAGTCGKYFVDDLLQSVVFECKDLRPQTKKDIINCKISLIILTSKYPDFDCYFDSDNSIHYKLSEWPELLAYLELDNI